MKGASVNTQFKPGHPGLKPKGATSKFTKTLKAAIANFCENSFEQIEKDFQELTPKERCQLFAALVQYVVPKKASMEIEPIKPIPDEWKELSFDQLCRIEEIRNEPRLLTNG